MQQVKPQVTMSLQW